LKDAETPNLNYFDINYPIFYQTLCVRQHSKIEISNPAYQL